MALKFLNKKGWHTGSLRNIENVWKAEQKHEAEQKKLEELRKQIQEERERSEFRLLQEQAGLVPKQERLEFLYDSGLAVGKGSSSGSGFKALESSSQKTDVGTAVPSSSTSSSKQQSTAPGALFEEKSQSANDAWRKLHSDPLLLIRQREQEALARVKNNPIQMAMIRKSIEATENKGKVQDKDEDKEPRNKHHRHKRHQKHSASKSHPKSGKTASKGEKPRKASHYKGPYGTSEGSDAEPSDRYRERKRSSFKDHDYKKRPSALTNSATEKDFGKWKKKESRDDFWGEDHSGRKESPSPYKDKNRADTKVLQQSQFDSSDMAWRSEPLNKRRDPVKLSNEERAVKLREMQMDAELHEEQRWKRIKKAEENDAEEVVHARLSRGRNFLDAVQMRVYGTDKGGSSTIEESVRRRTHYLQGRSESTGRNAFRR